MMALVRACLQLTVTLQNILVFKFTVYLQYCTVRLRTDLFVRWTRAARLHGRF